MLAAFAHPSPLSSPLAFRPPPLPRPRARGGGVGGGAVIPPRRPPAVAPAPSAAGALPPPALLALLRGALRVRAVGVPSAARRVGCPRPRWAAAPAAPRPPVGRSPLRCGLRARPPLARGGARPRYSPFFARPLGAPPGRPRRGARRSGGGCVLRRPCPPPAAVFPPPAACAAARRAVPSCWCGYAWAVLGGGGRVSGSLRVRALRSDCDFLPSHLSPLTFRPPLFGLPSRGGRRSLPPSDGAPRRGCRSCYRLNASDCTNI